jgi:hypothetical protein
MAGRYTEDSVVGLGPETGTADNHTELHGETPQNWHLTP